SGQKHSDRSAQSEPRQTEKTVDKNIRENRLENKCHKTTQQKERPPPTGMLVPRIESVNRDSRGPWPVRPVSPLQEKPRVRLTSVRWTIRIRAPLRTREARYSPSCSQ